MSRKISVLIISVLVISLVIPVWAHPNEELSYYTNVVTQMGIMDFENSTDFMGEEFIERERAVKYILNLMNITHFSKSENVHFKDVSMFSESFDLISTAVSVGIIKGDGSGYFRPNDKLTGNEASIMILRAMNYELMTINGTNTYEKIALTSGLLNGVEFQNGYIDRNNFARMLYNSFGIGILEQTAFGTTEEYVISKDRTSLSFRNLKRAEGIVTSTPLSSLYYSDSSLANYGTVIIKEKVYNEGVTNTSAYLGYNVEIFYDALDNENPLIIYSFKKNNKEKKYSFLINGYIEKGGKLIGIDKDGKETTIKISPDTCMILNGEAVEYDLKHITQCGNTGSFTLVENSNSGYTDTIFINSLKNDIVSSVDPNEGYIYLKNGTYKGKPYIELPIEEKQYNISVIKDGKNIEFTELATGDVISYGVSENGLNVSIFASTEIISGVVSEIINDNETTVVINGKEYALTNDCYTESGIEFASSVTASINSYGKAVSVISGTSKNYAAVLACGLTNDFESKGMVKLFTSKGSAENFAFAEKVTINDGAYTDNGNKYISHTSVINMLNETKAYKIGIDASGNNVYKETSLISYELDKNGDICNIEFEQAPSGDFIADSKKLIHSHTLTEKYAQYTSISIDGIILVGTPVFRMPTVNSKMDSIDEMDCSIRELTRANNYNASHKIKFYDVGYNGTAGAVVMNEAAVGYRETPTSACIFIKSVIAVGKDGFPIKKIYYLQGGEERTVLISPDVANVEGKVIKSFNDLKFGDIITFETDIDGYMDKFSVYYSPMDEPNFSGAVMTLGNGVGFNRDFGIMKGIARYNDSGKLTLEYEMESGRSGYELFTGFNNVPVTVLNFSNKSVRYENCGRIKFTNFNNGASGDEIVVFSSRNSLTEVICYE